MSIRQLCINSAGVRVEFYLYWSTVWKVLLSFGAAAMFASIFGLLPLLGGLVAIWTGVTERFRVRCPQCFGTGVCHNKDGTVNQDAKHPVHSCCGDCQRVTVPVSCVPDPRGFGNYADGKIVLGCGWVPGNLWQRLRRGGPLKKLGIR